MFVMIWSQFAYVCNLLYDIGVSLESFIDVLVDIYRMLCSFFRNSLFIDVLVDIGVVFTRRSDAFQALKKYNNVQLDGKPMKIEIAGAISDIPVLARGNVVGVVNGKRTVVMKYVICLNLLCCMLPSNNLL
ncbi:hypothetical protein POM88_053878 [Heracleum sosnowskyi]|uniref:Uncharacterized protein n=1 Tax=Heracleum sosnowskyi TaxID=360622 RepID=A0AAD8LXC8_9APIA|nr:hypothetical protein POM88_053878 [Heracleum sosnowskyi]